jgi:23S rRNA (uridine2552-2'-O)-methyltransferase
MPKPPPRQPGDKTGKTAKSPRGGQTREKVKTAHRRSAASTRWLARQLADPYVAEAHRQGYRSRAAFKLLELDQKFGFLKTGMTAVDLGAAPGGWTQVLVEKLKPDAGKARIVALDILEMDPLPGATLLLADFEAPDSPARLREALGGARPEIVLSDLSPNTSGHTQTDHLRIMRLVEGAYDFAATVLAPGGIFVAKVFQGGSEGDLLARLKADFRKVRHYKPPASRQGSAETYVIAEGFRG